MLLARSRDWQEFLRRQDLLEARTPGTKGLAKLILASGLEEHPAGEFDVHKWITATSHLHPCPLLPSPPSSFLSPLPSPSPPIYILLMSRSYLVHPGSWNCMEHGGSVDRRTVRP